MIVEIAGGIISNSLAILTDAAHMLSDVGGMGISMISIWIG
jgi:Co/Zn/Cd efflux system component